MKVLLIGGGGREHALAWKIASSPMVKQVFAAPGNPGIAEYAQCTNLSVLDFDGIERFVRANMIDFVVIGPEDPLAGGLADRMIGMGIKVFGPSKNAAQLEA